MFLVLYLSGFDVAKTGDARIGFVGFPSVGKSTLLSNLAGVYSEVAAYEFTTLTTVPGVIRYKGAKIQVQYFSFFMFLFTNFIAFSQDVNFFALVLPLSFLISRELLREPRMEKAEADKSLQVEFAALHCVYKKMDAFVSNQCLQLLLFSSSGSNLQPDSDCA